MARDRRRTHEQGSASACAVEWRDKVGNLRKGGCARESRHPSLRGWMLRSAAERASRVLGRGTRATSSARELRRVNHGARRGGGVLEGTARKSRRSPREQRARVGLNNRRGNSDLRREQDPEGAAFDDRVHEPAYRLAAAMALRVLRKASAARESGGWRNVRRVADVERRHGSSRGSSEGRDPMSASGMEQARRVVGGASRQEGENPWRRSVVGCGKPGVWIVATGGWER